MMTPPSMGGGSGMGKGVPPSMMTPSMGGSGMGKGVPPSMMSPSMMSPSKKVQRL
jgi:hypothetical protein